MPIYEFKCPKCGKRFERLCRVDAGGEQDCPACGARAGRVISQVAFVLKGDGWYVTDHPSKARREALKAEKSQSPGSPKPAPAPAGGKDGTSA